MIQTSEILLPLLIFLPLVGMAAVFVMPARLAKHIGFGFSLLGLGIAATALQQYLTAAAAAPQEVHLQSNLEWVGLTTPWLKISFHLGIDGISVWLVMLTALLMPVAILASYSAITDRCRAYYGLMLLLQTAMLGVFTARDLLLFYIFFEMTLIPLFFIIGIWGGPQRKWAATKFFIYTLTGGLLTLTGIVYMGYLHLRSYGYFSFEMVDLQRLGPSLPHATQIWLFMAFFAGFAFKVPLFPFHTWLPLAHTEAPTAGSVVLAAVLLKLGTYGFLRIALPMLPQATYELAGVMAVIAIIGIIYAALAAWVQSDIKKLVAYSSVSHLGFCMLGMYSLQSAGLQGSILYMVNHGLSTGALFLVVGMIYERYHTREINALGGLARRMPVMAFFLVLFTLSSIGLPGLNGFVGEFLVLLGTFTSPQTLGIPYAAVAATGVVLGAVYMLWMCRKVLFGRLKEPPIEHASNLVGRDLNRREVALLTPIAVLVLAIGVMPKPFLHVMQPSVEQLLAQVQQYRPTATAESAAAEFQALAEPTTATELHTADRSAASATKMANAPTTIALTSQQELAP